MAIHSPLAAVEAVGEVFVEPCIRIGRVIGQRHKCRIIHQPIQHFSGVDIIRRIMRGMVELRQLHHIGINDQSTAKPKTSR